MIGYLSGKLIHKGFDLVLIDVGGVGYRVEVPLSTLGRLEPVGQNATVFIHTHVREDALKLYGFETWDALRLFERLITVSGVGPRTGLSALSQFTPTELETAIVAGDVRQLCRISGVGKKTAERIIIDLSESLARSGVVTDADTPAMAPQRGKQKMLNDLEEALRYLGYKDREIRRVVGELKDLGGSLDLETLLKQALKLL